MLRRIRNVIRNTKRGLKEYCSNSSLAGLSYIVNERLHYTERAFWAICFAVSCFFSYSFISSYQKSFSENAISLVIETVQPHEITKFPSLGVCEVRQGEKMNPRIEELLETEFSANGTLEDLEDIQKFVHDFVYPPIGSLRIEECQEAEKNPTKAMQCPKSGFKKYTEMALLSCEELILDCKWQGKSFNCCNYFLPLYTNMGKCFLLNSIQTTKKDGDNWLNVDIGVGGDSNEMELVFKVPISVTLGNDDNVPNYLLDRLTRVLSITTCELNLAFNMIDMINDDGIKKINYIDRKCKFPEENDSDLYKYYSFSTCTATCMRDEQLRICNCTFFTFSMTGKFFSETEQAKYECDLDGIKCLSKNEMLSVSKTSLQPWRSDGLKCTCFPSCKENQIKIIQERIEEYKESRDSNRTVTLKLQSFPKTKFRRQSVRGKLEVVVTIGGILSLFLGASILSGIEFLYFLIVRILLQF